MQHLIFRIKEMSQILTRIYDTFEILIVRIKYLLGMSHNLSSNNINFTIDTNIPIMNNKYAFLKQKFKTGTYGSVGIIQNIHTKTLYACKKIKRKNGVNSEYYIKQLHSEYCMTSALNHNNVLKAIEIFNFQNEWYEVLEFCQRGDLYSIINKRQLSIEEIEHYFKQLINGLAYLHEKGIVHRDIKLENLLVTSNLELKIGDFGVADVIRMEWENEKRQCYGVFGSPPYLAPEIYTAYKESIQNANKSIKENGKEQNFRIGYDGEKADVWSAGVVLYILLFNFMPFSKAHKSCHAFAHFMENKNFDDGLLYRLPIALKDLIIGMLEPEPKKRLSLNQVLQNEWFKEIKLLNLKDIEYLKDCHKIYI